MFSTLMTANRGAIGVSWRLVLVAAALYLVFRFTDLAAVLQRVTRVDPAPIAIAFLLFLVRQPLAVGRWKIILANMGVRLPFWELLRLSMASLFFGLALPANGSDFARGVLMRRWGERWSIIAASIVLDRLYGVISLLLLVFPGGLLLLLRGADHTVAIALVLGNVVLLLGMTILMVAGRSFDRDLNIGKDGLWHQALTAFRLLANGLRHPRASLPSLLLSVIAQIVAIASAWFAGISIGLHIPFAVYLAFVPMIWLITTLPVTIMGIGLREASFATLFATAGIPAAQSVSVGLLNSAIMVAGGLLGGLAYLLPGMASSSDRSDGP